MGVCVTVSLECHLQTFRERLFVTVICPIVSRGRRTDWVPPALGTVLDEFGVEDVCIFFESQWNKRVIKHHCRKVRRTSSVSSLNNQYAVVFENETQAV
jgi:hypothetical protein